jgi:hypothetical protein
MFLFYGVIVLWLYADQSSREGESLCLRSSFYNITIYRINTKNK